LRSHRLRNWALLVGLTVFLLALDQGSKLLVTRNLAVGEMWAPIPALSKFFTITHVRNTGVAFGQLTGLGWLFMIVNLAVFIGILIYFPRIPEGQWQLRVASGLIMAGALGNVISRLRAAYAIAQGTESLWAALPRAYVTDFFDFKIWPVSNVADACVVAGAIIVAWTLWKTERAKAPGEAMTGE
jgi:signal peptidase II